MISGGDDLYATRHNALTAMRQCLGLPHADWTCDEQRDAMVAVLERKTDVMALIKTGGGKSMLAIVPAVMAPQETTVVVLPLQSLMTDYKKKLDRMNVLYEAYEGDSLAGIYNLILVSADMAKFDRWRQAIQILHQKRPVVRVCMDECQFSFTANDFRWHALNNLFELRFEKDIQLVLLSGTVPGDSEDYLKTAFGLLRDTKVFRTDTNRPEIKYILEPPRDPKENARRLFALIKSESITFSPRDRGLIFVGYLDDGKTIAEVLNLDFYTGDESVTREERVAMMKRWWQGGDHNFMVCTSSFSAGNDYSHVRLIIHFGNPREMIGYIQESSRAGRDHQAAISYILLAKLYSVPSRPELPAGEVDHRGVIAIHDWFHGTNKSRCLRHVITSFCDRKGTFCRDDPKSQLCSICDSNTSYFSGARIEMSPSKRTADTLGPINFGEAFHDVKRRLCNTRKQQNELVETLLSALQKFDGRCPLCYVVINSAGTYAPRMMHDITQCPCLTSPTLPINVSQYLTWRRRIEYKEGLHRKLCFFCHVPQLDPRLHGDFVPGGKNCIFPDVIIPTIIGVYYTQWRQHAQRALGVEWNTLDQFLLWLIGKPAMGSPSNVVALFIWFCNQPLTFS